MKLNGKVNIGGPINVGIFFVYFFFMNCTKWSHFIDGRYRFGMMSCMDWTYLFIDVDGSAIIKD